MPRSVRLKAASWHDDLYRNGLHLLVGPAEKAQQWIARHLGARDLEDNWEVGALTFYQEPDIGIWFPRFRPSSAEDLSILAHECFHVTNYTLRPAGLRLTDASQEAYAYHLGWVYREYLERLKR